MRRYLDYFFILVLTGPLTPFFVVWCLIRPAKRRSVVMGTTPLINYRNWARGLQEFGISAVTVTERPYHISSKDDFDLTFDSLIPKWLRDTRLGSLIARGRALEFCIREAKMVVCSFQGFSLDPTPLWWIEGLLFRARGIHSFVVPYGADAHLYSKIRSSTLRHVLLSDYPDAARRERKLQSRVQYWEKHATIIPSSVMLDSVGRYDLCVPSLLSVDVKEWKPKDSYSDSDGRNGTVVICHSANHFRGKGTEFLQAAIAQLKQEGLSIDFRLMHGIPNSKVREIIRGSDIHVEQLIMGYAMSAVEGMALGLPVVSNFEEAFDYSVFRRYSFLGECPIVSATPETIADRLRELIQNPALRRELGQKGRHYVEKYHSNASIAYIFTEIDKAIRSKKISGLINLFHPLIRADSRQTMT